MKKNKKIGIIATLALACGMFVAGGIGFAAANQTVHAATVENLYILDEYDVGKVFTIPQGRIRVGEKTVDSEYGYLVFPSGKATDKSPVTLDEEGIYELVYTATVDGQKVKATANFVVTKQIYKVGSKDSSVYFGSDPALPALEGIVLNIANQDEFIYDEIIDLSDNTANDPLVKFSMSPATVGNPDVTEIVIRFTDIYDESNYVNIHVKNVASYGDWALRQSYVCIAAANQKPGGWERAPHGSTFHSNNVYGFPVYFSMTGVPSNATLGYDVLTLSFDAEEKAVYADNPIYGDGGCMIADLDDSDTFLNPWQGFTTGEVRMSVYGVDYKVQSMNAIITEIDGEAPKKSVTTDVAPIIEVQGVDGENCPYALVGKEYRIFDVRAFDTHDGEKDAAVNVYYNYGKENQTVCSVVDGKFIPKRTGVYTIVYTAKDNTGNQTEKVLHVEAFDHDGLSMQVTGTASKGYTGKEVTLFEEILCENASGEISYTVTINGEELEAKQGAYSFIPLSDGEYEVTVKASDYVKEETFTFTYKAIRNYAPQIFDDVQLPKYFIQGEEIKIPQIVGYDFSSGSAKQQTTKIFVKENGGAEKALEGNTYTPTEVGSVEVIYRLNVGGKIGEKSQTVNVVSVFEDEDLRMEKYFQKVSGDVEVTAGDNYISLLANKDSAVEFINRVQVRDFYMTFVVGEGRSKFSKINIYFTDVADAAKQVKFTYIQTLSGASFAVNDGKPLAVDASFKDNSKNFMLTYANGRAYGSALIYSDVKNYLDGSAFAGFTSDFAYLTIEMEGVYGESEICLKNLNRQSLNNADKDRFSPQILTSAVSGDRALNEEIRLNSALAADVLSNNWEFTMKVTAPDGKSAVAKNGVVLNGVDNNPNDAYDLVLSSYGEYVIEYYAKDRFGKEKPLVFYVTVKDNVAPEVTLGSASKTAKVGATVTVANVTITDNVSTQFTTYICVEAPGSKMLTVKNNKFVADKAGEYVVRYMVWDEAGNHTFKSYVVTVK